MRRKWMAAQGTWIFIVMVLVGFGFAIYRSNPWSLQKKCEALGDIQAAEQLLKNYPDFNPNVGQSNVDYVLQRNEFAEQIKTCKAFNQRQRSMKN